MRAAQTDAADSRELLLEAALAIFAEKGFDGATARDIAARAGVNHGLIRYYFGDKERLWRSAVDRAFAELAEHVSVEGGEASDRERLAGLIHRYVRFVARKPEFVRLMHEEGKRKGPRMRWIVDRHVRPLFERLELLRSVRGVPADIPLFHLNYIFAGAAGLMFHQAEECKRVTGQDPFDPAVVENHARAVEYLLLGPPDEKEKP